MIFDCRSTKTFEAKVEEIGSFVTGKAFIQFKSYIAEQNNLIILEVDVLFRRLRMLWRQLEDIILSEQSQASYKVTSVSEEFLRLLYQFVISLHENRNFIKDPLRKNLTHHVQILRKSVLKFSDLGNNYLHKITSSSLEQKDSLISCYFHTYLEMQLTLLLVDCTFLYSQEDIRNAIKLVVDDLIVISKLEYNKASNKQKQHINPFLCDCVKQMWMCIQMIVEEYFEGNRTFWDIFNSLLENVDPVFSLWMLYHVGNLQGINNKGEFVGKSSKRIVSNHNFLEEKIKELCNTDVEESLLYNSLIYTESVLNIWWSYTAKVTPYQILWEYFYKSISGFEYEKDIPNTASDFFVIKNNICTNLHSARNSYELFVAILANFLKLNKSQWTKLKGRIYSRLPVQKTNCLNDTGLYQIFLLFTSVAFVDFEDLTMKMQNILKNLPWERQSTQNIWNLHTVLIMLYIQNDKKIGPVTEMLMHQLHENANSRENFHRLKLFIKDLDAIMNMSVNYHLDQHILFGNWTKKYMLHCQYADLDNFLQILTRIVENVYKADAWSEWDNTFQLHIFPSLKQASTVPNASPYLGKLAATLSRASPELSTEAITYFGGDLVAPKVCSRFIATLLQDYPHGGLIPNQENFMIQAWVRCCILSTENQEELTRNILKLHGNFALIKNKLDLKVDVLCSYIDVLGQEYHLGKNVLEIKSLFETSFNHVDLWIKPYIKEPVNDALTLQIYTLMSLLIYHCSPLMYSKTKSACLLSRLTSVLLTPPETLMGRVPNAHVLSAVRKTWHLFAKGILKLDWKEDAFLERILKDLIVCYLPHFPAETSPIIKCFDDPQVTAMMLQKISTAFLNPSNRCPKESSVKALRFISFTIEQNICTNIIADKLLFSVLEFLLFNLQCNAAIGVITCLAASHVYNEIRECVQQSVVKVTEKHLSFNASNYFSMTNILAKLIPLDVRAVLPIIKERVMAVERMRGVGYDAMLRRNLDGLESSLSD